MKKIIGLFAISILTITFITGCGRAALTGPPPPSASAAASTSPATQTAENGEDETFRTVSGDWVYYLDLNSTVTVNNYEEHYIHRQKKDGGGDTNLKLACYKFSIAGDYLYVDVDSTDDGTFPHWKTSRYNLDGSGKKDLDYTDMRRLTADGKLYFTCFNDNTVYIADTACEKVIPLKLTLPDENTIKSKLAGASAQISLLMPKEVKDGWISFTYDVADKTPSLLYTGNYRINADGSKVEKLDEGDFPDMTN